METPNIRVGDVWKIRLPNKTIMGRERVIKIMHVYHDYMKVMEVPYSTFQIDLALKGLEFIEKIPQE